MPLHIFSGRNMARSLMVPVRNIVCSDATRAARDRTSVRDEPRGGRVDHPAGASIHRRACTSESVKSDASDDDARTYELLKHAIFNFFSFFGHTKTPQRFTAAATSCRSAAKANKRLSALRPACTKKGQILQLPLMSH